MNVDVAAISDTGRVREGNEDSFLVDNDLFIFAVADGMGGHVAGEIASATAVEAVRAGVAHGYGIETSIAKAHDAVKTKASSEDDLSGMGTTFTAMGFSSKKELVIAHVGDSRAYVLHRGILDDSKPSDDSELVRITKDHSLVEELVDAGQITQEEADVHPRRSVITRALGIEGEVDVDVTTLDFQKGDRYLLCSDGLTAMVRDEEITSVLKSAMTPNECARELVSRANQAGGNDNITVIIIDVRDAHIQAPQGVAVAQSVSADTARVIGINKKGRFSFLAKIFISLLVFAGILGGAYATANYYAHEGFYLDEQKGQVVLMAGHEGGTLWWDAQLDTQTGIEVNSVSAADKLLIKRHARFSSRKAALARLNDIRSRTTDPTQTTSTTTTTSQPHDAADITTTAPITISQGTSVSQ